MSLDQAEQSQEAAPPAKNTNGLPAKLTDEKSGDKKSKPGIMRGFGFALAGIPYVLRRPKLLMLSLIPIAINLALGVGLFALGLYFFDSMFAYAFTWDKPESWWLAGLWWTVYYLIKLILVLALAMLDFLAIIVLGSIIGAPFHELISCAVEKEHGRTSCDAAFSIAQALREIGAALRDQGVLLAIYLVGLLLITLLNLIPVVGNIAASALSLVWTWWFFALEFTDPPLSRWGLNWKQKWKFLRSHLGHSMSFGLGAWLLLFIPLTLPFLVASGTLMSCELYPKQDELEPEPQKPAAR